MNSNPNTILAGDVVVILGGGLNRDGSPTADTIERARAAVQLAAELPKDTTFIFSGDGRSSVLQDNSEAVLMYRIFVAELKKQRRNNPALKAKYGIRWEQEISDQLRIEQQSRDTIGNATIVFHRFLRDESPRTVHVITSPFHMERAKLTFEGILGDDFNVVVPADLGIQDNEERAANESGGIEYTENFCSQVTAGDSTSVIRHLLEMRPGYNNLHWLRTAAAA